MNKHHICTKGLYKKTGMIAVETYEILQSAFGEKTEPH
jgi:hypothetical protein